jgi:ribonuclease-3
LNKKYNALEKKMNYLFKDKDLLDRALSHASHPHRKENNEKLEFLGDRVLGLVLSEIFFKDCKIDLVGDMAQQLSHLASRCICAQVTDRFNLFDYASLSKGISNDSQANLAVHANLCEALIGAIYLDGGLQAARTFIQEAWRTWLEKDFNRAAISPKNALQELAQAQGGTPIYTLVERSGPDHAPRFTVKVEAGNLGFEIGVGSSQQAAGKAAAQAMLNRQKE